MVGGYDNDVDVDTLEGSTDPSKCRWVGLSSGQQTLVTVSTQTEFRESWSEVILKNTLPLSLVDDPGDYLSEGPCHNFSNRETSQRGKMKSQYVMFVDDVSSK